MWSADVAMFAIVGRAFHLDLAPGAYFLLEGIGNLALAVPRPRLGRELRLSTLVAARGIDFRGDHRERLRADYARADRPPVTVLGALLVSPALPAPLPQRRRAWLDPRALELPREEGDSRVASDRRAPPEPTRAPAAFAASTARDRHSCLTSARWVRRDAAPAVRPVPSGSKRRPPDRTEGPEAESRKPGAFERLRPADRSPNATRRASGRGRADRTRARPVGAPAALPGGRGREAALERAISPLGKGGPRGRSEDRPPRTTSTSAEVPRRRGPLRPDWLEAGAWPGAGVRLPEEVGVLASHGLARGCRSAGRPTPRARFRRASRSSGGNASHRARLGQPSGRTSSSGTIDAVRCGKSIEHHASKGRFRQGRETPRTRVGARMETPRRIPGANGPPVQQSSCVASGLPKAHPARSRSKGRPPTRHVRFATVRADDQGAGL